MITQDNITEILDSLTSDQISKVKEDWNEYILLEVHCTNSCVWSTIESVEYDEEVEQEANDNGQLFCDFDTFLQLFKDSNSINPFLIELI